MADIRLDSEFFNHPKTVKLERACGEAGIISLQKLWIWAAANRPNGDLNGLDDEDIEIAGKWAGESGAFASALVRLHWLDGEPGQYRLHGWAKHNHWAASGGVRSDQGRLGMLKRHHPELYDELKAKGVTGLSKAHYGELMAGTKTFEQIEAELAAMAEAEQEPEAAKADEAIGAALEKLLDPAAQPDDEQNRAVAALLTFPTTGKKLSQGVAAAWIARMQTQYPKLNLDEAIRDAAEYAARNKISVKSSRGYLSSLFENRYGTPRED